jgi:glutamyl-tRNA synthetase
MTVRTRFAPSPTGYLHIGGVRSALFNWLFAKQHGGQFILRIDDTDQQRNVAAALSPILEGFRWLGIDWDEGPEVGGPYAPYYQSERTTRYQDAVKVLLERGLAYRDYATTEEVQAERAEAEKNQQEFIYSRRWMAETDGDAQRFEAEGRQAIVRLKMPREGQCEFVDLVRGPMTIDWSKEQDHVVQRADGTCLYHLANVVDDHDFKITHVIRAIEHLPNTPRQIFIGQALGYELPAYAHLPFVAEPSSKNKLSKRKLDKYLKNPDFGSLFEHGMKVMRRLGKEPDAATFNPVIVDFYRDVGYLPDAIMNYLLLLGWSLDDKTEDFSRAEMIEKFSLDRVIKAPASFDPAKLLAFQQRYESRLSEDERTAQCLGFLTEAGWVDGSPDDGTRDRIRRLVGAVGDRLKVGGDILEYGEFFDLQAPLEYDGKAFEKRLAKPVEALPLLTAFRQKLDAMSSFEAAELENELKGFVEERGIKIGQIIHALRVAVTGKAVGFGMFETLELLGKSCVLRRIDETCRRVSELNESSDS